MRKSTILLTLLLVSSIAGTYAVYELYVKQRWKELGDHQKEEEQLRKKITQLEELFFRTKPDTVLSVWRAEIQPWATAVDRRTDFYTLGQIPLKVEIPEEEKGLAKWYYRRVHTKMVQEVETRAWQSGVILPDPAFGTPDPSFYGQGSDPSAEEISEMLAQFEFGKAVAYLLIDSGVKTISVLEIWPEQIAIAGRRGDVKSRMTGLAFTIPMRNWVVFFENLSQEDRYFEVKALHLSNSRLRDPYADLNVEMILAQAYYEEAKQVREVAGEMGPSGNLASMFANMFGRPGASVVGPRSPGQVRSDEKSWWDNFRRKYLPF